MKLKLIQLFNLPFKSLVQRSEDLGLSRNTATEINDTLGKPLPSFLSLNFLFTNEAENPCPAPSPTPIAQGHCVNSIEQWLWTGFTNTGTMPEAQEGKAFRRNSFVSPGQVILVPLIIRDPAVAHGQDKWLKHSHYPKRLFPCCLKDQLHWWQTCYSNS